MNGPASLRNPITPWEDELSVLEPIFASATVFCIASGPSLTIEACDKIKGRPAIAVNSSAKLAPWADVLFFTDNGWYEANRDLVTNWPGEVITLSRLAKRELRGKVKRIKCVGEPTFPPRLPGMPKRYGFPPVGEVHQGRSSGHTAIALAIGLGATRVAMVGYDMQVVAGREHFHSEYKGPRDLGLYASEFVPGFRGWRESAARSGVEIINCTSGSAVTEFPFIDLDDLLAEGASCDRS